MSSGKENPVYTFSHISSTNDAARRMIRGGEIDGDAVIVADVQTAGKGRKRRDWVSPRGGLWLTRVLLPRLRRDRWPLYSFLAGVAAVRAIKGDTGVDVRLKWPNDLIFRGKKMGGILLETVGEEFVLIGVGINLAVSWPSQLAGSTRFPPVNLCCVSGYPHDEWCDLRAALLSSFNRETDLLHRQTDVNGELVVDCWRRYCETLSCEVLVKTDRGCLRGTALDVDDDGSLVVKRRDGEVISLRAGEVSVAQKGGGIYGQQRQ